MSKRVVPNEIDTKRLPETMRLYAFEGDDLVALPTYKEVMRSVYLTKLPLAEAIIKRFHVPIDEQDRERLKRMLVAIGWLDHLIDESTDRAAALQIYSRLIRSIGSDPVDVELPQWARSELIPALVLLRNALATLPNAEVTEIIDKALRIGDISRLKALETDVSQLIELLIEEAHLSSDLVIEVLSAPAKTSPGYLRLHEFDRIALTGAVLWDASLDIKHDYQDGLIKVSPRLNARVAILKVLVARLPEIIAGLGFSGCRAALKAGLN